MTLAHAPLATPPAGEVKEEKTLNNSKLSFIDDWKEGWSQLKFPMELDVGHRHSATANKGRYASLEPEHYGEAA
jgi:hypothetical protein